MSTLSSRIARPAKQRGCMMRACCETLESRRLLSVVTTGDQFGLVDGKHLILQQVIDGDIVRYNLTGDGTGQIVDNSLVLTGTTGRSSLIITVRKQPNTPGADGLNLISGITADGLMKAITAKSTVVAGDVALNTTAVDATTVKGVAITLNQMQDGSIDTGGEAITSLKLQNWAASGVEQGLRAAWIGTLNVAGDLGATLSLDGRDSKIVALRTANVKGTMGNVDAPSGGIVSLTAGAIDGTVDGLFIGTLRTRAGKGAGAADGSLTGEIRAIGSPPQANRPAINTLQVGGNTDFLTIRADEGSLGNITINGTATFTNIFSATGGARNIKIGQTFSNSRIQTQGGINSITLGAMADSNVLVGVPAGFGGAATTSNGDFVNGVDTVARLGSFTAGRSQRGMVTPQITGTDNLSAAQIGKVNVFNMESTSPPSLQIYTLEDAGKSPASVRFTDNTTPTNSFSWRAGQPWPDLLQAMLTWV